MQKQAEKYCPNCRKLVNINCEHCPDCGFEFTPYKQVEDEITNTVTYNDPTPAILWRLIGFLCPVAGLVLYIVFKDKFPTRSKLAGRGALTMTYILAIIVTWIILKAILVSKGLIV